MVSGREMTLSFPEGMYESMPVRQEAYNASTAEDAAESPLIVSCPHAGRVLPGGEDFERRILLPVLDLDRRGDTYTDWLSMHAKDVGAVQIVSTVMPMFLNVGRSVKSLHPDTVRGGLRELDRDPGDIYAPRGQGLVATTCFFTGKPVYGDGMAPDEAEIQERIDRYYTPFHDRLKTHVDATHRKHGYALVFDVHSCPTFAGEGEPDATGTRRPNIILSNAGGGAQGSCPDKLVQVAARLAEGYGYTVKINTPYKGGFITQTYGAHNQADDMNTEALQIEFARSTYGLGERTLDILSMRRFEKAQRFMNELLKAMAEYAGQRACSLQI